MTLGSKFNNWKLIIFKSLHLYRFGRQAGRQSFGKGTKQKTEMETGWNKEAQHWFSRCFLIKKWTKKESSHDVIFINNEPHSKFILTYMENKNWSNIWKIFFLHVCQFTIYRNLIVRSAHHENLKRQDWKVLQPHRLRNKWPILQIFDNLTTQIRWLPT